MRFAVEELYLTSDALRVLSKLTRYLIVKHNVVLKMSDPLVLTKVFETCQDNYDGLVIDMFTSLKAEMSKPSEDDATCFVFYADQNVMRHVQSAQNVVVRDKYGNERIRNYR